MGKEVFTNDKDINDLFLKVVNLVTQARERVATAVNIAEVYTKFHIGQYIVEYEQKGETRAEYGKAVLREPPNRPSVPALQEMQNAAVIQNVTPLSWTMQRSWQFRDWKQTT